MTQKAFLIILDGWGHSKNAKVSAIDQANTPFVDSLYDKYPNAELVTYGDEVGLPEGQMGNSEVGHLNIGAGRIVYQAFSRINNAIADGSFGKNETLVKLLSHAKQERKAVHFIGLVSDGGVHSHISHLKALCQITENLNLDNVFIHAFLDGRDTSPSGGKTYLQDLIEFIKDKNVKLSSIIGRYFAMDRDKRWERTRKAYDLLVKNISEHKTSDPISVIQEMYDSEITDEFMPPIKIETAGENGSIKDGDVVICFNFRTDRPRQITEVLSQNNFPDYEMSKLELKYGTMTNYKESYQGLHVLFDKENLEQTLGETISKHGLRQLRIAETEKYPHVTFFFNGGQETAFDKEERIVVASPKVATYDLQPEMSAYEVTNEVHNFMVDKKPDLIILNYANADMVGHTGDVNAAVKSVETLDACLESLVPIALKEKYNILIIADHGNADIMVNEDGSPHTAHTTNPVPIFLLSPNNTVKSVKNGKLADIAPTILSLMNVEIPNKMTGDVLI